MNFCGFAKVRREVAEGDVLIFTLSQKRKSVSDEADTNAREASSLLIDKELMEASNPGKKGLRRAGL